MGWSIENIRPQLDSIFENEGKRYSIQHPDALSPRVFIQHEGELSNDTKWLISSLFPAEVYIDFFPNISFGNSSTRVVSKGRRVE